jgi:WD40 repeat protein/tRNA A-37 threonylcarbamoyl transferase component Bud32
MPALQHLTAAELEALVLGQVDEVTACSLEEHLSTCPECQQRAAEVPSDTLVELLRSAQKSLVSEAATPPDRTLAETLRHGPAPAAPSQLPPPELAEHPRYRPIRPLGFGGMGTVWLAEHKVMNRLVALKVIRPEFLEKPGATERFHREVQAAARLHHPNIVTAFDAEQAGDVHCLVMEYVKGTDLQKTLEEHGPLPVPQACEYVRQAAQGLQHATEHGMVHRDIKPQNLMIQLSQSPTRERGTGEQPLAHGSGFAMVKILDFGLASLTETQEPENALTKSDNQKPGLTQLGALMGTPDYMAPEQARDPRKADVRSDIYSLGCTLYSLLTGKVPFPGGTAVDKVIAHAERRPQDIRELRPEVPAALVKVLDKMLAKNPAERYQTPAEVAAALAPLSRYSGRGAGGEGRRRRILAVAPATAAALLLLAGSVIYKIVYDNEEITIATDDAKIEIVIKRKGEVLRIKDKETGQDWDYDTLKNQIGLAEQANGLKLGVPAKGEFVLRRNGKDVFTVRRLSKLAPEPSVVQTDGKGGESRLLEGHTEAVVTTAFSADGQLAATAGGGQIFPNGRQADLGKDFGIRLWDVAAKKELYRLKGHTNTVQRVAFSPNRRLLASASADKTIRLWDVATGKQAAFWVASEQAAQSLAFSPDGKRLVSASWDTKIHIWDTDSHKDLLTFGDGRTHWHHAVYSPDGRHIAACGFRGFVVFDADTGKEVCRFDVANKEPRFISVAYSADGKRLLTASQFDGDPAPRIRVWEAEPGRELYNFSGGFGAAFASADGHKVLAGGDGDLFLVDLDKGHDVARFRGHNSSILSLAVTADGTRALSGSADNTARLWRLPSAESEPGWTSLFNGKDLTGWAEAYDKPNHRSAPWDIVGDVLQLKGDEKNKGYLRTEKQFREFHLRFEYKPTSFAPQDYVMNSALMWGVQGAEDIAKLSTAELTGGPIGIRYELATQANGTPCGTAFWPKQIDPGINITGVHGGTTPADGWNRAEIIAQEGTLELRINGVSKIAKGYRPAQGFLALYSALQGLHFRKIEIKELSALNADARPKPAIASKPRFIRDIDNKTVVRALAYSPDGKTLIAAGNDAVRFFDVRNGEELYKHEITSNVSAPISVGQDAVAFVLNGHIIVVDLINRKKIHDVDIGANSYSLALSPDARTVVYAADGSLRFLDFTTGKTEQVGKSFFSGLGFTPDGRFVIAFGRHDHPYLTVLDAKTRQVVDEKPIGSAGLTSISKDGSRLAAVCPRDARPTFTLFDLREGKLQERYLIELPTGGNSPSLSPDGSHLALSLFNGTVQIWDVAQKRNLLEPWAPHGPRRPAAFVHTPVALSPDGKSLATGGDSTIKIWDLTPQSAAPAQAK